VRLNIYKDMKTVNKAEATAKLPELISKKTVAFLLGVSTRTVFTFRKRGKLQGFRIGNQVKYQLADVLEFINKSKTN
jgi:carbamoylphosphate synthase small subunit